MDLPNNYDAWRLDNGESSSFFCDNCGEETKIQGHDSELESICERCHERLSEDD